MLVKPGDVVTLRDASRESPKIKELIERMQTAVVPKWIDVDRANVVAKIVTMPAREDIDFEFNEQLIVELYSK